MPAQPPADALHLSWEQLDALVERLAGEIMRLEPSHQPEAILAVSRGGLVPGAMLAYRMSQRDLLVAVAEHYDERGRRDQATITRMPPDEALRGRRILIVDEVWESGRTLQRVAGAAEAAGAEVRTAVLHFKPSQSETSGAPDHYAATATGWVIYPYKGGE
ncbi:MAG: phosphoribosyltransferase [Candidatus Limnocylindrus sp.]